MKDVVCPICGSLMRLNKNPKILEYICPKCKYKMDSLNWKNLREK